MSLVHISNRGLFEEKGKKKFFRVNVCRYSPFKCKWNPRCRPSETSKIKFRINNKFAYSFSNVWLRINIPSNFLVSSQKKKKKRTTDASVLGEGRSRDLNYYYEKPFSGAEWDQIEKIIYLFRLSLKQKRQKWQLSASLIFNWYTIHAWFNSIKYMAARKWPVAIHFRSKELFIPWKIYITWTERQFFFSFFLFISCLFIRPCIPYSRNI